MPRKLMPHQTEILNMLRRRQFMNGKTANALAKKHNKSPSAIWMTYLRFQQRDPKLAFARQSLGRRVGEIVRYRSELRRYLLREEGKPYIRLPTTMLTKKWGFSQPTIVSEAKRVLEQLRAKGHKFGQFSAGRPKKRRN